MKFAYKAAQTNQRLIFALCFLRVLVAAVRKMGAVAKIKQAEP